MQLIRIIVFCICLVPVIFPAETNQVPAAEGTAEDQSQKRQRITVVARRQNNDPRNTPGQVSVISSDQVEASGARNAGEILSPVLGVQVEKYGGASQPAVISIRGSSPEQVLVLVNGRRLNSAQGGGVDLSSISTSDIERIEVIRGGGTSLYGENAIGGVVNIITKKDYGKKLSGLAEYRGGSFNSHSLVLQLMGPLGRSRKLDFYLGGDGFFTAGNYRYEDLNTDRGWTRRTNESGLSGRLSAKLGWDINREHGIRLALSGSLLRDKKGVPGLKEFPSDSALMLHTDLDSSLYFSYLHNRIVGISLDIFYRHKERHYTDPDFFLGAVDDTHLYRSGGGELKLERQVDFTFIEIRNILSWQLTYDWLTTTAMQLSGDSVLADDTAHRLLNSIAWRSDMHFFSYSVSHKGRLSLFPSLRVDLNDIYPNKFSWNIGLLVPFDKYANNALKGNIGSAYRMPSFADLFWSGTAFAAGNQDLEPEEALVYDIGLLSRPLPYLSFEVVHFGHYVSNLIQWNPGPDGRWRPDNIGRARLRGLEVEVVLLIQMSRVRSMLELAANYNFLFATDITADTPVYGKQLPRRPFEKFNLALVYSHEVGHSLRLDGRYTGYRFTTAQNTRALPGYFLLDMSVKARIFERLDLLMTIKNMLNTHYVDIREYPVPGIELSGGIRGHF